MKNRKVIAILGLPGSGKTETIEYLIKKTGWPKIYFGDVTFDELKRRSWKVNEKNEKRVREELRAKYGQACYAREVIRKIKKLPKNKNILVESLYSWVEYLEFKKNFGDDFISIGVYASPRTRYQRLAKRPVRPLRTDEAQSRDYAQIENLSQAGPIAMADYTVINERKMKDLYNQLDQIIKHL